MLSPFAQPISQNDFLYGFSLKKTTMYLHANLLCKTISMAISNEMKYEFCIGRSSLSFFGGNEPYANSSENWPTKPCLKILPKSFEFGTNFMRSRWFSRRASRDTMKHKLFHFCFYFHTEPKIMNREKNENSIRFFEFVLTSFFNFCRSSMMYHDPEI